MILTIFSTPMDWYLLKYKVYRKNWWMPLHFKLDWKFILLSLWRWVFSPFYWIPLEIFLFPNRSFGIHLDIAVCHINASGLIVVSYDMILIIFQPWRLLLERLEYHFSIEQDLNLRKCKPFLALDLLGCSSLLIYYADLRIQYILCFVWKVCWGWC